MFETYTTTTIEDTDIFCNLSVYKFWTKVKIIHHLDRHIKGFTTDIPFPVSSVLLDIVIKIQYINT